MATEGSHNFKPPNLTKAGEVHERVKRLVPGDPWTILLTEPLPPHVTVGFTVSRWYDTSEPGRLFQVTAVHAESIETVYVGFENAPTQPG